jgi:hypothetical protein
LLDGTETAAEPVEQAAIHPQAAALATPADSFPQGLVQDCSNNPGSARCHNPCGKLDAKAAAAYRFATHT